MYYICIFIDPTKIYIHILLFQVFMDPKDVERILMRANNRTIFVLWENVYH